MSDLIQRDSLFGRPLQSFRRYLLDRVVLRPSREPIDAAPQRRVMLQSAGRPLECFVHKNYSGDQPPELVVLKFPGTAGRAERSTAFPLSTMTGVRAIAWTWNPPGYGGSGGRASLVGIAAAALDFWEQVTHREADHATTIWLCGNSLGCATALHVAATVQPNGKRSAMILRNPPPLIPIVKRAASHYPLGRYMGPVAESVCDAMNAMLTARRVGLPAVFLQSEMDTLVPPAMQNEIINVYAGQHRAVQMEGLGHSGVPNEQHEAKIETAIRWLWQQTRSTSDETYNAQQR